MAFCDIRVWPPIVRFDKFLLTVQSRFRVQRYNHVWVCFGSANLSDLAVVLGCHQ